MKTLSTIIPAIAATLALSAVANATELYTPILTNSTADPEIVYDCEYLNVGTQPLSGTISIRDYQNNVLFSGPLFAGPGHGGGAAVTKLQIAQVYCKVSFTGEKDTIRVSLCMRSSSVAKGMCQAVVEAR